MGSSDVYTFSFSDELKTYYRSYYDIYTTAEMAELTWIGANPGTNPSEPYNYNPLAIYSLDSGYTLNSPFDGGRIYIFVPWRWSVLSKDQQLPPTWKTPINEKNEDGWGVDYLDYIFSNPTDFAIIKAYQGSGWTPSITTNPIPFGYVETNSGSDKTNNGDLSLIDGNSLPLTIQQLKSDPINNGAKSSTTGTSLLIQDSLWRKLLIAGATQPSTTVSTDGTSYNPIFDWVQLPPDLSDNYSNLKPYLQHLASLQAKDPQTPLAFLANDPAAGESSVNASAYFYTDTNNNPFILVDGGSGNKNLNTNGQPFKYSTGLWLLPWDAHSLLIQQQQHSRMRTQQV